MIPAGELRVLWVFRCRMEHVKQVNLWIQAIKVPIAVCGHLARFTGNARRNVDYTWPRFPPVAA